MAAETDHYADRYWNDLPRVLEYLCQKTTGDPQLWWMDYFKRTYATCPFHKGLIVGCGNGWVDRDFIDRGIVEEADAFDVSEGYLSEAESLRENRPIHYFQADFSSFSTNNAYDLIVNVSSLHHAERLYRLTHVLYRSLLPSGVLVNWEYVGPSRNQYTSDHVKRMAEANSALPERFRSPYPLRPPLHQMLSFDPNEAVHSDEIFRAVGHYFECVERHDIGGGIAYQILWNNLDEFEKGDEDSKKALEYLLQLDDELTTAGEVPVLFSFFICRKRLGRETAVALFDRLIREPTRETFARFFKGAYPRELLRRST